MSSGMYGGSSAAPINPGSADSRMSGVFAGMPVHSTKRRISPKIFLICGVIFLALPAMLGGVGAAVGGEYMGGVIIELIGLGFLALFGWLFMRELGRSVWLYDAGIEQVRGTKSVAVRWNEVTEIWFTCQKVQAGGLLAIAGRAAMNAFKGAGKDAPINEKSVQVTLRIVGPDKSSTVKLNAYDAGVIQAWEMSRAKVNPRLASDALKRIQAGETVTFGKVGLSRAGIAFGKKAPTAFQEVEKIGTDNGVLTVRKAGKWLAAGSIAVAQIPNLHALGDVIEALAPGKAEVGTGMSLAAHVNV